MDKLDQILNGGFRMVDQMHKSINDFTKVVGRNVGGHTDGDTRGAVDEEVGESARKHQRLFPGVVVVGYEVDRVLVDIF